MILYNTFKNLTFTYMIKEKPYGCQVHNSQLTFIYIDISYYKIKFSRKKPIPKFEYFERKILFTMKIN